MHTKKQIAFEAGELRDRFKQVARERGVERAPVLRSLIKTGRGDFP